MNKQSAFPLDFFRHNVPNAQKAAVIKKTVSKTVSSAVNGTMNTVRKVDDALHPITKAVLSFGAFSPIQGSELVAVPTAAAIEAGRIAYKAAKPAVTTTAKKVSNAVSNIGNKAKKVFDKTMKKIGGDRSQSQPAPESAPLPKWKQTANKLFSGAAAGVGATAAIYPLDYVGDVQKSWANAAKGSAETERLRNISSSFSHSAKEIYKTRGGVKGLYHGVSSKLVKVAPAMALTFALNDSISKHLSKPTEKTAARSTYPLARLSMLPVPIPTSTFDNALIGRMNSGGAGLYPMEREIATTLETTPDTKQYSLARFTTNPFGAAAIGTASSLANEFAKKRAHRTLAKALSENPKTPMGAQLKDVMKYLMRFDEPGFAERAKAVQDVTKPQMFGRALKSGLFLGGAALAGRLLYPYVTKGHVNKELNAYEGGNPSSFIRTKLREDGMKTAEFPVALLDDVVIQGNRMYMAAMAAQQKKDKPVEKKANVLLEAAHIGERAKHIMDVKKKTMLKAAAIIQEHALEQAIAKGNSGFRIFTPKGKQLTNLATPISAEMARAKLKALDVARIKSHMSKQATLDATLRKATATIMLGSAGVGAVESGIATGVRLSGIPQKDKMIQMAHRAKIDSLAQAYKLKQATPDTIKAIMKKAK